MRDELTQTFINGWLYLSGTMIFIGLSYIFISYLNKYLEKRYQDRLRRLNAKR